MRILLSLLCYGTSCVSRSCVDMQVSAMPIDHVMIKVGSWEEAKKYYSAAIKPLGYEPVADWGTGKDALLQSHAW